MQLDDRLLPLTRAAEAGAAALGLRLAAHRAHAEHPHVPDLLDGLADLGLVGVLVDAERVLVGREQGVALLRHDRLDDHAARVHDPPPPARAVSWSMAAWEAIIRAAPTMSATPA